MLIVPHAATVLMLSQFLRQERTIRLYTNNVKPTLKSVRADFKELAVGKGYKPVVLAPGKWDIDPKKPGENPQGSYPKVVFTFTDAVGPVYGFFVTNATGALDWAEWFEDGPYDIKHDDDEIKITPIYAMGHRDVTIDLAAQPTS